MKCKLCNQGDLTIHYQGKIRKGKFPNFVDNASIYRCTLCEGQLYDGPGIDYETEEYRSLVDSHSTAAQYYKLHDSEQSERLSFLDVAGLRGGTVIDVGAGAGSFLDLVKGFAGTTVAIEPGSFYHEALKEKSHHVFSYGSEALTHYKEKADLVTCFSVIEHIGDPVSFMNELAALCKPGGTVLLSTPNSDDWLIEYLPLTYKPFFYRVVHRWYFNATSLKGVAQAAGFTNVGFRYKQRFNLSNAFNWIKDGRPTGQSASFFSYAFEGLYRHELEAMGKADYIYLIAKKQTNV